MPIKIFSAPGSRSAVGLALALLIGAASGSAQGESLQGAWTKAYASNPTIAAERARLRSVDEGVPQALSGWRPRVTVTGQAGATYTDQQGQFNSGADTNFPTSINSTLTQPLYRGGRTTADTKRAMAEMQSARAALMNVEQQIMLDVGTAYMEVLRDQAVVELTVNNQIVLERQLQATQDRFSVGEVTRTDVAQAEARVSRAAADLQTARADLETSRAFYTRQVGEPPVDLEPPNMVGGAPESLAAAVAVAADFNPIVIQAIRNHEAAGHVVRLILGELYPSLDLNGQLQQAFEPNDNTDEIFRAQATIDLTAPLYQSGSVYARVRGAKQAESQALQEIEESRRVAIEGATQAWEQVVAQRARIVALESEINANEIALEGVQQEALVGTRTVLDILDAEQALLDSRVNLVRARRDEFVAVFDLITAVGGMTAERLALDVPLYDPTSHYKAVRGQWFGTAPNQ